MRRNARSITTSPEIVKHIDGLTQANFQLLCGLIESLAANEKVQRKFRHAMIQKITKLEAMTSLLLVAQEAETLAKPPFVFADKFEAVVKRAEQIIEGQSEQEGMKMVRYIYGKDEAPPARHDRRRSWSGWEI